MKQILITGLDGSGKSTMLQRLEEMADSNKAVFIRVPKIDADLYSRDKELYLTTCFINEMHDTADILKLPSLKVIALFSSMLVFHKLLEHLNKSEVTYVFCERHPLVDTVVYSKFYSSKMNPDLINNQILKNIELQYPEAVNYLSRLIQVEDTGKGLLHSFLSFIHHWFAIQKLIETKDLMELFRIGPPDKIFYLSASAETLMARLSDRAVLEAHESLEVLFKLIPEYDKVLNQWKQATEILDAESFDQLNLSFENIVKTYFMSE